ncbi:hypothetical protein D0867_05663 [Hortaea werneckii]|uniref:Integrase catalytic domain-containing protein n=1 Tax=Hortaea werneckii TaxID=91943 RepID=A0A3M6ZRN6_HORWE|nr:hypothetical protein D0867_05663 [Hortaea werneckii]
MSWLSPKRRRTTGNLKTLPNGDQQPSSVQPPPATTPSNDDSVTVDSNAVSLPTRPRTQPTAALHGKLIPDQPTAKRPTTLARPLSQPLMSSATLPSGDGTANGDDGNGNLFYAYARKANDLQSRYLLTFANASIANEWWSLLQEHFHDVSRPSPQLFSFKDPELLSKAWKNISFAHLKSKWMYISFSDTASNQLGGAAQGIIPVQDAAGNLLGGGAPASSREFKQAREVTREVKHEMSRLEERFERMMGAIEKNGDRMASLLEARQEQANTEKQDRDRPDQSDLSSHLEKITELLAKNSEYVQGLEKRQASNEKAIREELKKLNAKPKERGPDMSQLSSHLDKIQKMMEQSLTNRKDGSMAEFQPVQIDFSPLTERLTKVQEAVEQNSALVKELLDEGANSESRAVTPFWGKNTPVEQLQQQFPSQDLSPLTEHLEKIHQAIAQQSNHMQALVGFASGGDEECGTADSGGSSSNATVGRAGGDTAERSLAPLGEHLEQIYNAIEQGNTQAQKHWAQQEEQQRSQRPLPIDLKPLLEAQDRTRLAVEAGNKVDMGPLVAMFDGLIEHMRSIREDSRSVDSHLQELIRKQNELTDTFAVGGSRTLDVGPLAEKLDQVNEHLEILREWSEFNAERWQEFVDARGIEMEERRSDVKAEMGMLEGKFDTLSELVQALRASSNTSTERLHELLRKPQQELHTSSRPPSASSDIDLTPLNDRLSRIHDSLERQVVVVRGGSAETLENNTTEDDPNDDGNEIQGGRRGGVGRAQPNANLTSGAGDPKFLITALTSHLSKIQAVTDTNAQQLSRILQTFSPPTGVNKPHHHQQRKPTQQPNHHPHNPGTTAESLSDPPPSSRHITTPTAASTAIQQDHRLEATHSQVRELMAGQREMIDAVRELAKSIQAEKGGSCEHVVIPPPRKVGRKVVGFVYDGKERGGG